MTHLSAYAMPGRMNRILPESMTCTGMLSRCGAVIGVNSTSDKQRSSAVAYAKNSTPTVSALNICITHLYALMVEVSFITSLHAYPANAAQVHSTAAPVE